MQQKIGMGLSLTTILLVLVSCFQTQDTLETVMPKDYMILDIATPIEIIAGEGLVQIQDLEFLGLKAKQDHIVPVAKVIEGNKVKLGFVALEATKDELVSLVFRVAGDNPNATISILEAISSTKEKQAVIIESSFDYVDENPLDNYSVKQQTESYAIKRSQLSTQNIDTTQIELEASFASNPLGDVNGNGTVDFEDAIDTLLIVFNLSTEPATDYQLYHADLNCSGTITFDSAIDLLLKVFGLTESGGMQVCPRQLQLQSGDKEIILIGNTGNENLGAIGVVKAPTTLNVAVTDVTPNGSKGTVYEIEAIGNNQGGSVLFSTNGATSAELAITIGTSIIVLESPTQVVAEADSSTKVIQLSWKDNSSREIGYEIQRKKADDADFTTLITTAANEESYTDTNIEEKQFYFYRIRAIGNTLVSVYSETVGDSLPVVVQYDSASDSFTLEDAEVIVNYGEYTTQATIGEDDFAAITFDGATYFWTPQLGSNELSAENSMATLWLARQTYEITDDGRFVKKTLQSQALETQGLGLGCIQSEYSDINITFDLKTRVKVCQEISIEPRINNESPKFIFENELSRFVGVRITAKDNIVKDYVIYPDKSKLIPIPYGSNVEVLGSWLSAGFGAAGQLLVYDTNGFLTGFDKANNLAMKINIYDLLGYVFTAYSLSTVLTPDTPSPAELIFGNDKCLVIGLPIMAQQINLFYDVLQNYWEIPDNSPSRISATLTLTYQAYTPLLTSIVDLYLVSGCLVELGGKTAKTAIKSFNVIKAVKTAFNVATTAADILEYKAYVQFKLPEVEIEFPDQLMEYHLNPIKANIVNYGSAKVHNYWKIDGVADYEDQNEIQHSFPTSDANHDIKLVHVVTNENVAYNYLTLMAEYEVESKSLVIDTFSLAGGAYPVRSIYPFEVYAIVNGCDPRSVNNCPVPLEWDITGVESFEDLGNNTFKITPSYNLETESIEIKATSLVQVPDNGNVTESIPLSLGELIANEDTYNLLKDTIGYFYPGDNDTKANGDFDKGDFLVIILDQPDDGILLDGVEHQLSYLPNLGFEGIDSFRYFIVADGASSLPATVYVSVGGLIANEDEFTAVSNQSTYIEILDNDLDVDGSLIKYNNIEIEITDQPKHGQVSGSPVPSYKSDSSFGGIDSFTYRIKKDGETSFPVRVEIDVLKVTLNDDSFEIVENGDNRISVLANDVDTDGKSLRNRGYQINIERQPSNGELITDTNIYVGYVPNEGFSGVDSFEYSVSFFEHSFLPQTATVTVNVLGVSEPPPPSSSETYIAVAAGGTHSLALLDDGSVQAWGFNRNGESIVPADLGSVKAIAAGGTQSLVLLEDGTLRFWGANETGHWIIGNITDLRNVKEISLGNGGQALALLEDGTVYGWGNNLSGQAAVPEDLKNVIAISAGTNHSLALLEDGSVRAWGNSYYREGTVPQDLGPVKAVSAGDEYSLALLQDGTVRTWGKITKVPEISGTIKKISTQDSKSIVLLESGELLLWDSYGNTVQYKSNVSPIRDISSMGNYSLMILENGTIEGFGDTNGFGQQTVPSELQNISSTVIAHYSSSTSTVVNVFSEGTVLKWGGNYSYPDELRGVRAIAPGLHTLALHDDGTVTAWGQNDYGQSIVPSDLGPAKSIAVGLLHSLALLEDGTVKAWGSNKHIVYETGQSTVPEDLGPVKAIAAGEAFSIALLEDGTTKSWGSINETAKPIDLGRVESIAAGRNHVLALLADGSIQAWGSNSYGQTLVPDDLGSVKAIAAGYEHSLALLDDGSIRVWGLHADVPSDLTNVKAIAAGYNSSVALLEDGTIRIWGQQYR